MRLVTDTPDPQAAMLYLVRHGRTEYNATHQVQGRCDSPMTATGMEQIAQAARSLAQVRFTACYASPSPRALTTARGLLAHHPHLEPRTDAGLMELDFGDWEERLEADLFARHEPVGFFASMMAGTGPGLPGGESGPHYLARVMDTFARIENATPPGGATPVVSHGVTLATYLAHVTPEPPRPLANCEVTMVALTEHPHRQDALSSGSTLNASR